jgi:hypothetical protein
MPIPPPSSSNLPMDFICENQKPVLPLADARERKLNLFETNCEGRKPDKIFCPGGSR